MNLKVFIQTEIVIKSSFYEMCMFKLQKTLCHAIPRDISREYFFNIGIFMTIFVRRNSDKLGLFELNIFLIKILKIYIENK